MYWLNRTEIDVMAARCLIELGTPTDAEPLLTRALAGYNPAHAREVALYQTWLAEGHARTGDLDAARAILDGITGTAAHAISVRLQRRIAAVNHLINRRAGKRTTPAHDRPPSRRPPRSTNASAQVAVTVDVVIDMHLCPAGEQLREPQVAAMIRTMASPRPQ